MHPGIYFKKTYLTDVRLAIAAMCLNVSESQLSRVTNGKCDLTPDMALRFEKATGKPAMEWMLMQCEHNLSALREDPNMKGQLMVVTEGGLSV